MENVKSSICQRNKRILKNARQTKGTNLLCDCRVPSECPLEKKYLSKSIVYKVLITTKDKKIQGESRLVIHSKNETELSKYLRKLKNAIGRVTILNSQF